MPPLSATTSVSISSVGVDTVSPFSASLSAAVSVSVSVFWSADNAVVAPSKSTRLPPPELRLRITSPVMIVPGSLIGASKTNTKVPALAAAVTSRVDVVNPIAVSGVLFTVNVPPVISPCAALPPLFAMFG